VTRIEIIRGPASALYGGNAMGGLINIITDSPKQLEAVAKIGYGSDETLRHSVSLGNRFMDKLSLHLGYEIDAKIGYRFKQWDLYAYAKNLTDKAYINHYKSSSMLAMAGFGDPRTVGVGLLYRF
jgi:outer membrane receptor protein involved in Fe transport